MDGAKIHLSEEELTLVRNGDWLLTKNRIIGKVYELFGQLAAEWTKLNNLPETVSNIPPKIAKGEQFNGLPYVMLDYPRCFGKEDVFAIRTFFWWGNFFSITLQLKGAYLNNSFDSILKNAPTLSDDFFVSISGDEWDHDLTGINYMPVSEWKRLQQENTQGFSFLKIAAKIGFDEWNSAAQKLSALQKQLCDCVRN
ncbi:MAG: hypothetical protein H7Y31_02330 [Chitinophagaceae bacterium]|nr:hypothetical protein [Chitinophagaceae bacterium]